MKVQSNKLRIWKIQWDSFSLESNEDSRSRLLRWAVFLAATVISLVETCIMQ